MVQSFSNVDHLWQAARAGDRAAFEQLVQGYRPYLKTVAAGVLGSQLPSDRSDAVQNGLLQAFKQLGQCQATNAAGFLRWLTTIVRREALHMLPQAAAGGELPSKADQLAADSSGPDERAARREHAVRILAAIARMPEDYQQVIDLRNRQELAFDEVARQMARSNAAARQLWTRAMKRLRIELGENL